MDYSLIILSQINVLRVPAIADVPARKMLGLMELRVLVERDRRVSCFSMLMLCCVVALRKMGKLCGDNPSKERRNHISTTLHVQSNC